MTNLDYKQFTRRHRPQIHPPGAVLFVTCRLAGSVPKSTVRDYKSKKQWLENELKRAQGVMRGSEAPELKKWFERIETFKRDWFLNIFNASDKLKLIEHKAAMLT